MSILILTPGEPQWIIPSGASVEVTGTDGIDNIAIADGADVVFDASFNAGEDKIYIQGDSTDYTVSRSGATVTFTDASGNTITIPAGAAGQTLVFGDGSVDLAISGGNVVLGNQTVTDTAAAVTATVDASETSDDQFNGGVTPPSGTVTGPASVDEGTTATFTITGAAGTTYDWAIAGTSTASPADFDSVTSGSVTIPAGQTTVTFTVDVKADNVSEFQENFVVNVTSGGSAVGSATVLINDVVVDLTAPVITAPAITYAENQTTAGSVLATLTADETVTWSINDTNGFYQIDSATGAVSLTAAGIAAGAASNDFETTPNTFAPVVTATDTAGNSSTATLAINVTNVDDDAPVLQTAIGSATTIALSYNETLDNTSIPAKTDFYVTQTVGATSTAIDVSNVSISGSSVILTLASGLTAGATINVSYTEGSKPIQDDEPGVTNDAANLVNQVVTTDTTAPTLASSTPADNATEIAVGSNIVLTFSETVKAGAGSITIVNSANSSDTRTISITDTTQVSFSGTTVTINPTSDLVTASNYYVNIPSGAILDTIGNSYAGISTNSALNFSTPGGSSTGTVYTLTQNNDNVPGTAGDDTINGFLDGGNVTFSNLDVINGAAGTDTLTALGLTGTVSLAQVTNVEKFVFGTGAAALAIDFDTTAGETSIAVQNLNAAGAPTFTNIGMTSNGFTLGVSDDKALASSFSFKTTTTSGAADVVNLNLNSATGTITVDGNNGIEILNVTTSGAASTLAGLTLGAGVTKMTVAGNQSFTPTTAFGATLTTIDASSATGNVRIQNGTANALKFTGGSGNDVLIMSTAGAVTTLDATDTLNGGTGVDTLIVPQAATAATVANVSNFEIFGMSGAAITQDWSVISSKFANRASINSAHTLTLNNINDGFVVDVNAGGTLILGGLATPGASDDVTVNLGATAGAITLADLQRNADVETLVLNSQGTAANTLTTVGAAMTNLSVTGSTALTVAGTGLLTGTLDGSAMTGALTAVTSTTALTVLGGTAGDTLTTGAVTATQTINGNAGNDTINAAAAAVGSTINLSGGDGNDTITGPGAVAITAGKIDGGSGIDTINVGGATGAGTMIVQSTVTTVADADIFTNFTTTIEDFDYNGSVVNGATTTISAMNQAAGASLNATFASALAANTSATVYDLDFNLTGSADTALTNLAGATAATLTSLYATFENELVTAFAGAIAGLDTVLATTDKVLVSLVGATATDHAVVLLIQNSDVSTANTLTAAEIELIGVFNNTTVDTGLATVDFI